MFLEIARNCCKMNAHKYNYDWEIKMKYVLLSEKGVETG